jgi:hypothetical protein
MILERFFPDRDDIFLNPFHDSDPPLVSPLTPSVLCPGIIVPWDLGSPLITYPFPIHHVQSLIQTHYHILSIDNHHTKFVEEVKVHAAKHAAHLQTTTLSHKQMSQRLFETTRQLEHQRFEVCFDPDMYRASNGADRRCI